MKVFINLIGALPLVLILTGCPNKNNSTTSNRTIDGGSTVTSNGQSGSDMNDKGNAVGKNSQNDKRENTETPKKVESKKIGQIGVYSDKIAVSESNADLTVKIEKTVPKSGPSDKTPGVVLADANPVVGKTDTDSGTADKTAVVGLTDAGAAVANHGDEPGTAENTPVVGLTDAGVAVDTTDVEPGSAEQIAVSDLAEVVLEPNTSYVVTAQETTVTGEKVDVEQITIVTLADDPFVDQVTDLGNGEFSLQMDVGVNPNDTEYTVAIIQINTGEILGFVNPDTGEMVKSDEDKWSTVNVVGSGEDPAVAVVAIKNLTLDSELIAFAVLAKNSVGDETDISESVVAAKPDLLADGGGDSAGDEVQIAVPTNAPLPLSNKIEGVTNEIKELRAKIKKLKNGRKELTKNQKELNNDRKKLTQAFKKIESSKNVAKDELEKTQSELVKVQDQLQVSKEKSEKIKAELKSLTILLAEKTAELKKFKKQHKLAKQS